MTLTIQKVINKQPVTFEIEVGTPSFGTQPILRYRIGEEGRWYSALGLDTAKRVLLFLSPRVIAGAKVSGIRLDEAVVTALSAQLREITERLTRAEAAYRDEIVAGRVPVTLSYRDGEYLSGYAVDEAVAAAEMVRLGAAERVGSWGTRVHDEVVTALGTTFTLPDVVAYTAPAREAARAAAAEWEATRDAKFAEARATGAPVLLRRHVDACDGSAVDCSVDVVEEWSLPDGTIRRQRIHTH